MRRRFSGTYDYLYLPRDTNTAYNKGSAASSEREEVTIHFFKITVFEGSDGKSNSL